MIAMHHFSFGVVVGVLVEVQIEGGFHHDLYQVEYYQVGG